MSGRQHNSKRWHFQLDDVGDGKKGIQILRDGCEIVTRKGTSVGHVFELHTPSTRKLCKQAEAYLPYAVEVCPNCLPTPLLFMIS